MKFLASKTFKVLRLFALLLLVLVIVVLLLPQHIDTTLKTGGLIAVKAPSFLVSAAGGTCVISIKLKSGIMAQVDLVQGLLHTPLIVIPSTDENIFYCIYDHDTDFQLLKFDLNHTFHPLAKDEAMSSSILNSSCEVYRVKKVDTNDWVAAAEVLQEMSPDEYNRQVIGGLRLGLFRIHTDRTVVLNSLRNFGE